MELDGEVVGRETELQKANPRQAPLMGVGTAKHRRIGKLPVCVGSKMQATATAMCP